MLRTYAGCAGLAALVLASPAYAHHPSGVSSTGGAGPIATITGSTLDQGQSAAVGHGTHRLMDGSPGTTSTANARWARSPSDTALICTC